MTYRPTALCMTLLIEPWILAHTRGKDVAESKMTESRSGVKTNGNGEEEKTVYCIDVI